MTKPSANEAQVQASIIAWLRIKHVPFSRTAAERSYNAQGQQVRRVATGWPDITAIAPGGRLWAIECKRAQGGQLSYEQAVTLATLWEAGALITIARSIDDVERDYQSGSSRVYFEEIQAVLKRGPKLKPNNRKRGSK